jgi:glutaredoxin
MNSIAERTGGSMPEVFVYTRVPCGWCGAVKKQLDKHGYPWREIRADQDDTAMSFLMQQHAYTVPQVFVGPNRIGGYEDTVAAIGSGEFDRLYQATPAGEPPHTTG